MSSITISVKVNEDLEANGEASDFWSLSEEIKTAEVEKLLLFDQKYISPLSTVKYSKGV